MINQSNRQNFKKLSKARDDIENFDQPHGRLDTLEEEKDNENGTSEMFSQKAVDIPDASKSKSKSLMQSQAQIINKGTLDKMFLSEQDILPIRNNSQHDMKSSNVVDINC